MLDQKAQIEEILQLTEQLCQLMRDGEDYRTFLPGYVVAFQEALPAVLSAAGTEQAKWVALLEDMMYGMTQQDDVFLLDLMRFGIRESLQMLVVA